MYTFVFIASSLSLVLAVSASSRDLPHNDFYSYTNSCIPNQPFMDKCNDCVCEADGYVALCLIQLCPSFKEEDSRIDGYYNGLGCVPGTTFKSDCNSCACNEDGKSAICTLVAADCNVHARSRRSAPVARPNYPHIDNFSETLECPAGQMFYDQCNICHCSANGKSAGCTLMLCPGYNEMRIDNYSEGQKCPAGKTFKNKCNSCQCNADGLSAACTLMACTDSE